LCLLAGLYLFALVKPFPTTSATRSVTFFTQAACLFPQAAVYTNQYGLAVWSCDERTWLPVDRRAYFSIRSEDKESRFHRLAHFYKRNQTVMHALDEFVSERHASVNDGVVGSIGGVRVFQTSRPIPPPGSPVERFTFDALAPIPADRRDHYYTPGPERKRRCEAQR
jgi:hypothetical protein